MVNKLSCTDLLVRSSVLILETRSAKYINTYLKLLY